MPGIPALRPALLGAVAIAAFAPSAPADPPPEGKSWAVVIGVDRYADPAIPRLRFASADARLLAETLTRHCGYAPGRVLVLTREAGDPARSPTRANLERQIPAFLGRAGPGDTVLVYFSGHGLLDDRGRSYLAPEDAEAAAIARTGLRADELREMLRACRAGRKILLLDCCHAGGAGPIAGGPSGQEVGGAFRDLDDLVTLASCRKAERSYEWAEKGHGLFTHFAAEGLGGAADYDHDSEVDSNELFRYVLDGVATAARKELNVLQTPVRILGNTARTFAVARLIGRGPAAPRPPVAMESPTGPAPAAAEGPRFEFLGTLAGARAPAVFSPDGKTLATSGVTLWDVATRLEAGILRSDRFAEPGAASGPVGFSADGRSLVASADDPTSRRRLELWDVASKTSRLGWGDVEPRGKDEYFFPTFAPDGRLAYVREFHDRSRAESRNLLAFWDFKVGSERAVLDGPDLDKLTCLAIAPDGKALATGDVDGRVVIRDAATGARRASFLAHGSRVWSLRFSPRGDLLASDSSGDRTLRLWDPATGEKRRTLELEREGIYHSVAFHPCGQVLATGCGPIFEAEAGRMARLILWDPATGKKIPGDAIEARDPLAFSPDGTILAALNDRGIGLWAVLPGEK